MRSRTVANDPLWYKDAVIYELHVKSFFDSSGDGIGDFAGLHEKLDYIEGLGVTCLWLLPFFPSPLRDDGYDIADYRQVHTSYGTLDDFKSFLEAAHRRGLRVVISSYSTTRPTSTPGSRAQSTPHPGRRSGSTTSGATRIRSTARRVSSSPTPSARTGPGIPKPRLTTGTASSSTNQT
jgi:hypothetical protein